MRGATKAKICALVKKRAGAAKNRRPESSVGSRIGQKEEAFLVFPAVE